MKKIFVLTLFVFFLLTNISPAQSKDNSTIKDKKECAAEKDKSDKCCSKKSTCSDKDKSSDSKSKGHDHSKMEKSGDSKSEVSSASFNTVCPITGEEVDASTETVTYENKIYGFCCPGCIDKFSSNPEKYIKNLSEDGKTFLKN